MRPIRAASFVLAAFALLCPVLAWGAGYSIYEQGAAALGMAGAQTASVHDPSAVFFNPAALTRLQGTALYVGGTILQPSTSFEGLAPRPGTGVSEDMVRQTFYPPTLYLTHSFSNHWALGAGLHSPFGLGVEWSDQFSGRYLATKADLQSLNGTLCLAYAPDERWSVSAGADVLWAKVGLKSQSLTDLSGFGLGYVYTARMDLESNYTPAPGWNAAVLFAPAAAWKIGAYYRSKVIVHVDEGTAHFTQIPTGLAPVDAIVAANLPPDQQASTVLRFPAMWSLGVAWGPRPAWTFEADVNVHEWSVFGDLPIRFQESPARNTTRVEDYSNAWQARTGAEYRRGAVAYRAGYYFDKSPAPTHAVTPLLPDADRHAASLGLGWSTGPWSLDAYELAIFAGKRLGAAPAVAPVTEEFRGEYKTFVNAVGLSVGYHW